MSRKCAHWLKTYLEYTAEQESPEAFHLWTGLAVISATLGRHVFMERGYYTIFPNLYIVLLAGSAKCRKSVSSHIGINFIQELKSKPMIFSQKITNEALIKALLDAKIEGQSCGIIYASELSVFLGKDSVASGLIPTLTDLYASPSRWSYHTRARGVEFLENVSVCMLGASTMDWLKTAIPADAIGGGFTSRVIFVYQDKPRKAILFPHKTEAMQLLKKDLAEDLNHIRTQRGPMNLTPEAIDFATKWYEKELVVTHDAKLEGYFGRKHDTMFKLAMCLALAESDDRWIKPIHISHALELLRENEKNLGNVIATITSTDVGETSKTILNMIRENDTISHTDLLRKCWKIANATEIAEHIKTLIEAGEVIQKLHEDNRTRIYEATRKW